MTANFKKDELRSLIERIESIEAEKAELSSDITEVFAEAKAKGFVPKIMREIIRQRKFTKEERDEYDDLVSLYKEALGMEGTPLDQAAKASEEKKATQAATNQPKNTKH